jgi:hypothetical protein
MNSRFTAWFSPAERAALEEYADKHDMSLNVVVRYALRDYLGLPSKGSSKLPVTSATGASNVS